MPLVAWRFLSVCQRLAYFILVLGTRFLAAAASRVTFLLNVSACIVTLCMSLRRGRFINLPQSLHHWGRWQGIALTEGANVNYGSHSPSGALHQLPPGRSLVSAWIDALHHELTLYVMNWKLCFREISLCSVVVENIWVAHSSQPYVGEIHESPEKVSALTMCGGRFLNLPYMCRRHNFSYTECVFHFSFFILFLTTTCQRHNSRPQDNSLCKAFISRRSHITTRKCQFTMQSINSRRSQFTTKKDTQSSVFSFILWLELSLWALFFPTQWLAQMRIWQLLQQPLQDRL